jgi:NAD(P)-dependent dehydrogenase (short-subunit alcohol dehydrogenase family)
MESTTMTGLLAEHTEGSRVDDSLRGKTALVTGGSRGLGAAFARGLAAAGASVAVTSRDKSRAQTVADEIQKSGAKAVAVEAEMRSRASVVRAVEQATEALGPIDILVNNAGLAIHGPAIDVSEDDWLEVIECNLNGVWYASQAVGRQLIELGRPGSIVNIGSMSANIVNRPQMQPAYNASKAAVHHLTRSLAAEWAPFGIRVNALAPGYVKTEMSPVDEPQFRRHWIEDAPMQRYATPEEIVPTLVYLAGDSAMFMTGSIVVIDGGYSLY